MRFKRFTASILAGIMIMGLGACGKEPHNETGSPTPAPVTVTVTEGLTETPSATPTATGLKMSSKKQT